MRPGSTEIARVACVALVALVCLAASCTEQEGESGHGHDHGSEGHRHGDEEHPEHEVALSETVVSDGIELFVEYAALVAGSASTFTAHFTRLEDHSPIEEGSMAVVLTSSDAPGERFETESPVRAGIFERVVRPEHAGERTALIVLDTGERVIRFSLGTQQIVDDAGDVEAPDEGEQTGRVTLAKESQWKLEFGTARVVERKLADSVGVSARVRPSAAGAAWVRAPFAGRFASPEGSAADVGEAVDAGDRLGGLVPTPGVDAVSKLRSELREAEAKRDRAQRRVERLEKLASDGAVPKSRLLDARSDVEIAEARVSSVRQQIGQLDQLESGGAGSGAIGLRAPIDGTVAARPVTSGTVVERGERLFRLVDRSRVRIELEIPEVHLFRLEEPQSAWFEVPGVDRTFRVDPETDRRIAFGPEVDPEAGTAPLVFEIAEPPEALRVGQYLRGHVPVSAPRSVVAVTSRAVVDLGDERAVYVVRTGETFERVRVETGVRERGWTEVRSGVDEGDRVVSSGAHYVRLAGSSNASAGHGHTH